MATPFPTTGTQEGDIAAGYITGGVYSPNIPADNIKPAQPLSLPEAPSGPDYKAIFAGLAGSLPAEPSRDEIEDTRGDIETTTRELGTEDVYRGQKEDELGVTKSRKDLTDLQTQLVAVNNEAAAEVLNLDKQGDPTRLTSASILDKSNIERGRAIKALRLSSSIQAIQGNLELANDQVDRAIKLKYDPLRTELELLNKQLDYNYKDFDAAEKKRADAQKEQNNLKMAALDLEIDKMKDWERTKNSALANNAPLSVIRNAEAMFDRGDENSARAMVAPYTGKNDSKTTPGSSDSEIDEYAEGLRTGEFTVTNIPAGLRAKVRARAKEMDKTELQDLIDQNAAQGEGPGGYGTREDLIEALASDFPRLDRQTIIDEVYGRIKDNVKPEAQEDGEGGFIDSLTNWLFNG